MIEQFKSTTNRSWQSTSYSQPRTLGGLEDLYDSGSSRGGRRKSCQGVERFALDNERVRYLTEEEEQTTVQGDGRQGAVERHRDCGLAYGHATWGDLQS